jgi:ATP-dependent helicase/nuclease subunit A
LETNGETLSTLRGDRIFRGGAEPSSPEESHLWIVDYKTADHGPHGLDDFLRAEREKYESQLSAYARLMRQVHGEGLPLRLALYYPLLKKLLWWAPAD